MKAALSSLRGSCGSAAGRGAMLRRGKEQEAAEASVNTIAVQQDWRDREFIASVQLGLSQLSAFLNDFGMRNKPCSLSLSTPNPLSRPPLLAPTVASCLPPKTIHLDDARASPCLRVVCRLGQTRPRAAASLLSTASSRG